jgi:hypothetical protein
MTEATPIINAAGNLSRVRPRALRNVALTRLVPGCSRRLSGRAWAQLFSLGLWHDHLMPSADSLRRIRALDPRVKTFLVQPSRSDFPRSAPNASPGQSRTPYSSPDGHRNATPASYAGCQQCSA